MKKTALNFDFLPRPEASFNRAYELDFGTYRVLIISGTASVGPNCETMFPHDFEAQVDQTYHNVKSILDERGFAVTDIVKWKIYLRDINKNYCAFNKRRDAFFTAQNMSRDEVGASVCVEAWLCRDDLFVEIEAIAVREVN